MKDQKGAVVIMEAAFVFPIMFIVIFVMIMACEAYFQYARVESACVQAAIKGAARCENPALETVQKNGQVPKGTTATHVYPYRYIFPGQTRQIAEKTAADLKKTVEGFDALAFRGMRPAKVHVQARPQTNIFVSSLTLDCSFEIELPIRMIFSGDAFVFKYDISVKESIGDPAEFVRNVSTVEDLLQSTELGKTILEAAGTIKQKLGTLARFIN